MTQASLVLSHAGAGSILEALSLEKPLFVVVNDALMDNHQMELAGALDRDGHLICTGVSHLLSALQTRDSSALAPLPPSSARAFSIAIDDLMGFQ